jgi:DNA-binding NarL/FixJ family response regulator
MHNEMIKIMFEKAFKQIEVLDSREPLQKKLVNNAIYILDNTEENHQSIIEFLKDEKISNNCLILIDCYRKQTIRDFVYHKFGGLISYRAAFTELNKGIESIAQKEIYFSEHLKATLLKEMFHTKNSNLSPKESQVVSLFGQGLSSEDVAKRLKISPMTINVHRVNIKKKLGLSKNNQFIKYCIDSLKA